MGEGWLGKGLVTQRLSEQQWATLERINQSLTQEYATRRQMLLTRCDVTIQSFSWSERIKVYHTRPHPHKTKHHTHTLTRPHPHPPSPYRLLVRTRSARYTKRDERR